MDRKAWSPRLRATLRLACEPVAVSFAGAARPGKTSSDGKVSVCQAIKRAAEGESIAVTVETCGCPGGLVNLGLGRVEAV